MEANAGDEARIWARIPLSLAGIEFLEHRPWRQKICVHLSVEEKKTGETAPSECFDSLHLLSVRAVPICAQAGDLCLLFYKQLRHFESIMFRPSCIWLLFPLFPNDSCIIRKVSPRIQPLGLELLCADGFLKHFPFLPVFFRAFCVPVSPLLPQVCRLW